MIIADPSIKSNNVDMDDLNCVDKKLEEVLNCYWFWVEEVWNSMSDSIYFQFVHYSQPVLIVLGTIGVVLNQVLFFYQKPLGMSSCSL